MIANQNFDDSTDESEYGYSRLILHLPETSKKHRPTGKDTFFFSSDES